VAYESSASLFALDEAGPGAGDGGADDEEEATDEDEEACRRGTRQSNIRQ
jgi:hypothetical protein